VTGTRLFVALTLAASGCGRSERHEPATTEASAGAPDGSSGEGGSALGSGGMPMLTGLGGAGPDSTPVPLDPTGCETRPVSLCEGLENPYMFSRHDAFEQMPGFESCRNFASYDGCGRLVFSFDAAGCAVSVGPGPAGWRDSRHLSGLQACLTDAFELASFPCLASATFEFDESCYIP
jgi:hypothetical protein